jgi:transcriptional regulator with XRE-family HTH domain
MSSLKADTGDDISPALTRAARTLLGWHQIELAQAAGVAKSTITDFERGARIPILNNRRAIRRTLEAAGITFIADPVVGHGVCYRAPDQH